VCVCVCVCARVCPCILASFLHYIILSPEACLPLPYFSTLPHKWHDFWEKKFVERNMCLISSTAFFLKQISTYEEFSGILSRKLPDIIMQITWYYHANYLIISCKLLILSRKLPDIITLIIWYHINYLILSRKLPDIIMLITWYYHANYLISSRKLPDTITQITWYHANYLIISCKLPDTITQITWYCHANYLILSR